MTIEEAKKMAEAKLKCISGEKTGFMSVEQYNKRY